MHKEAVFRDKDCFFVFGDLICSIGIIQAFQPLAFSKICDFLNRRHFRIFKVVLPFFKSFYVQINSFYSYALIFSRIQ
jgi:hypothetical protein